jgi:hypothetical protein
LEAIPFEFAKRAATRHNLSRSNRLQRGLAIDSAIGARPFTKSKPIIRAFDRISTPRIYVLFTKLTADLQQPKAN